MSKKIGIPGWIIKEAFGVSIPYIDYISKFGQPVILTPDEEVREDLDLLFLPGGADVDTYRFGQSPGYYTGSPNQMLEYFDRTRLQSYIDLDMPIVGVCRGLQSVNCILGGSLTQHLPYHPTSTYPQEPVHEVIFTKAFQKYEGYIKGKINSRHHQSISELGEGLEIIAFSGTHENKVLRPTNVIEYVRHNTKPIYLVQSHPEDCPADKLTPMIIKEFLNIKVHA